MDPRIRDAALAGDVGDIRALVAAGGDVNAANQFGLTAIIFAAIGGHVAAIRALAELGGDTQAVNNEGQNAHAIATRHNHPACARWLERSVGWQPIHRICDGRRGTQHLVDLLRDGADPALRSAFGETPLDVCQLTDKAQGALPEDAAMTKLLQEALKPWHQKRHGLFPRAFAEPVALLLLVHQRLEQMAEQEEQQGQGPMTQRRRRLRRVLRVRLTKEIWLQSVVPWLPRLGEPEVA